MAAAKLVIRDEPVASWEMGLRAGQNLRILPDEGFFGFGVDAGTGCFCDAIAARAMAGLTRGFVLGTGTTTTELTDPESGAAPSGSRYQPAGAATRSQPADGPASNPPPATPSSPEISSTRSAAEGA